MRTATQPALGGASAVDTQLQNHSLRVERKHFTFDLRENPRGKFLRIVEEVKAQVVTSAQDSATFARLIPIAEKQTKATQEALRITRENFQIGTGLFLDVLQAEDAIDQARLRHASAITNYNKAQVNLLAALGLIDQTNVVAAQGHRSSR